VFKLVSSLVLVVISSIGMGVSCFGSSATAQESAESLVQPRVRGITQIQHIIILAQENRSLDSYFGALREYWVNNGYSNISFDGLPQFNPVSAAPPLLG
jgi:phospholipase C